MRRIKEKASIDRTSLRVLAAVLVPGLCAAPALAQQSSTTGPTKSGSGGALIKGHNEQGKNTAPGGTGAGGSNAGSAGSPNGGGDMRMTSGDGGGGDGGKLMDGIDEFIRRTSTGTAADGDVVIPPPGTTGDLLDTHSLSGMSAGGPATGTSAFPVGTVPAPGTLGLVGTGLALAVRRRRV